MPSTTTRAARRTEGAVQLILVDPNPDLYEAWGRHFPSHADVEIHCARFETITGADALVTAGNSFGLMDGGVDLAVARAFPQAEARVRTNIQGRWHGELNVGAAVVDITFAESPRWLVYAPTMRVPLDIRGTDNVYRAMWAALVEVERHNESCPSPDAYWYWRINTLMMPGLGTGAGQMPVDEAARQMALAWRNFNAVPDRPTWEAVTERHNEIVGGRCRFCQPQETPAR